MIISPPAGSEIRLNWKNVIGCDNYILAVQYLQDAQYKYANSLTYAESLVNDYIEKYSLTRFDEVEDEPAADGCLWVVQLGAYRSKANALAFQRRLEGMGVVSMIKQYPV